MNNNSYIVLINNVCEQKANTSIVHVKNILYRLGHIHSKEH